MQTSRQFNFKGKSIHYVSDGEGTPLVFIHGFCEDHRIWDFLIDDVVGSGYQYIGIDMPGFGRSAYFPQLSVAEMAKLTNALLDELLADDEQVFLFGHSMGGYVGLAFAEYFGSRLAGLGIIHSHPFADRAATKMGRLRSISFIEKNGVDPFVKQLVHNLFPEKNREACKSHLKALISRGRKILPQGIIAAQQAMLNRPDRTAVLSSLSCPVLFVVGPLDPIIDYDQSIAQALLPTISKVLVIPGTGHMAMFENPSTLKKGIMDFVGAHHHSS